MEKSQGLVDWFGVFFMVVWLSVMQFEGMLRNQG